MTLFDWIDTATPQPLFQGPPRPAQITIAEALGLELVDVSKSNGWTGTDYAVRCATSGEMCRLAHVATWHDFHGREIYLTEDQAAIAEAWAREVAA